MFDDIFNRKEEDEIPKQLEKYDEGYLLTIGDIKENKQFHTVVATRKELSELTAVLDTTRYAIMEIVLLVDVRDSKKLIKELKDRQKPSDLNYGSEQTE